MAKRNWRTNAQRGIIKYGPKAARYAAHYLSKYAASGSGTTHRNNKRAFTSTGITTDHYDKKLKYRYKRMPRAKRRRYVRRLKFVKHVIDKQLATEKVTTYRTASWTSDANKQGYHCELAMFGVPLASGAIATSTTFNRCINAFQHLNNISDGSNAGNSENIRWKQMSYCSNMVITNYGATTAIIDVYRVVCKRSYANSDLDTPFLDNSNSDTDMFKELGTGKPDAVVDQWKQPGLTPFQMNEFTRHFKILQVKEVQLPAGNSMTLSYRIPKNYNLRLSSFVGKLFLKGLTQGYILRGKAMPVTATGDLPALNLGVETETNVNVGKIDPDADLGYYGSKL